MVLSAFVSLAACSDDDGGSSTETTSSSTTMNGGGGAASTTGGGAMGGSTSTGGTASGGSSSTGGSGGSAVLDCEPLPIPSSNAVEVSTATELLQAVQSLAPGGTIVIADGTYDLTGETLWIDDAGATLIGKSQDATKVIIDGGYDTASGGLVTVRASDVTIAHVTLQRARYHDIHVTSDSTALLNTRIYGVRTIDPGEQAIKISDTNQGAYPDDGEIACSEIALTEPGRQQVMNYTSSGSNCYTGGIDAHDARGWVVRDNFIHGFYCHNNDLSEHGVHFWTGSRDTEVVRNLIVDNARGIGFGLVGGGRTYNDAPCGNVNDAGHYGGLIANNMIVATDPGLFASPNGMDLGIGLWHACGAVVAHNSVASMEAPFSSIEWRFSDTDATLYNNLVSHSLRERGGATAVQEGNIEDAPLTDWVDVATHDLSLAGDATAIGQGGPLGAAAAPTDYDGDARPAAAPDVGADQL